MLPSIASTTYVAQRCASLTRAGLSEWMTTARRTMAPDLVKRNFLE